MKRRFFSIGRQDNWLVAKDGNISIGTADAKGYKLAVNGSIHSKAVTIDLNGWSDYVLEKGYKLKPLSEVTAYIDQNKHLAEIPSEQDMIRKRLDISEMKAADEKGRGADVVSA